MRSDLIAWPKKLIAITAEVFDKAIHFGVEEIESIYNVRGVEDLEWEKPIVPSRVVNENQAIMDTPTAMVSPKPISTWTLFR